MERKQVCFLVFLMLFTSGIFGQNSLPRFGINVRIGPTYEYRTLVNPNESRYYSPLAKTEIPMNSVVLGGSFEYRPFKIPLFISTGFQYEDMGFKTGIINDTAWNKYGYPQWVTPYKYFYHLSFLGISVGAKYVAGFKKIKFSIGGGVVLNTGINRYSNSGWGADKDGYTNVSQGGEYSSVNVLGGGGIHYFVNENWSVMVEPTYTYCLSKLESGMIAIQFVHFNPYSYSLPLGINYRF